MHGKLADAQSLELDYRVVDRLFRANGHERTGGAPLNGFAEGLPFFAQKSALAHPVVVVNFSDVPAAVVVEKHDGDGIVGQQVLELPKALEGRAARIAEQQGFLAGKLAGGQSAVAVRDLLKAVDQTEVDVFGQNVFADSFRDVAVDFFGVELARFVVLFKHRAVGVHAPNLDVRVFFFEVLRDARYGSARADAHDKVRNASAGLLPDLGTRGFVVRLAVAQVVVLIGKKGIRNFCVEPARHRVVAVGVLGRHVGRAHVDFGSEGAEHVHFFFGLLVAHGANQAVSFDDGGEGEAHSGVARGAFNDGSAGLQSAVALGIFHHLERHAVFGGVSGVEVLHFSQNFSRNVAG